MNKDLFNDFDSWSKDDEIFHTDTDIIYNVAEERLGEWVTVYAGTKTEIKPSSLANNLSDIIYDTIAERLYDEVGEIGADSFFFTPEKQIELDKIIGEFLDKNAQLPCFKVEDIVEFNVRMLEEGGELEVKISE